MSSKMPPASFRPTNLITRYPALPLALGLAGWLEALLTIEWSFPYCGNQADGPASAVFGMPLPYIRWTGASSMEYELMPFILALNLVILFAVVFPLVSLATRKIASPGQPARRALLSLTGFALVAGVVALNALLVQTGIYKIPVSNIASQYETYGEFRPVRLTFKDLHYQCTPSNYWFGDDWRPKSESPLDAAR